MGGIDATVRLMGIIETRAGMSLTRAVPKMVVDVVQTGSKDMLIINETAIAKAAKQILSFSEKVEAKHGVEYGYRAARAGLKSLNEATAGMLPLVKGTVDATPNIESFAHANQATKHALQWLAQGDLVSTNHALEGGWTGFKKVANTWYASSTYYNVDAQAGKAYAQGMFKAYSQSTILPESTKQIAAQGSVNWANEVTGTFRKLLDF